MLNAMKSLSIKHKKTVLKFVISTALLMSLFSFNLNAQNLGKIEGSVSDGETYATIPAAKVELLNATDSVAIKTVASTNDGKYEITGVPFGKYMLRISTMAYQKQVVPDVIVTPEKPALKFGTTNLLPEAKVLKEVGVYGYKLTGQMEDDKTVYAIKEKSSDIAQSGLDLLRQLPDVNVDFRTNEVTLAGNNNILFQVNGKKVDRTYLMQLNPKIIDKIEIITNPGVKYDADVDAVINIILKKNMNFGLSGRVSAEIPTSKTFFTNNNVSLDYFTKGMRFFVAAWGGGQRWDVELNSFRTFYPNPDTLAQNNKGLSKNAYGGFNYGVDWFINDHNVFNFYSSVNPRIPNKDDFSSDNHFIQKGIDTHTITTSLGNNKNLFNDYSMFYKHKFAKKDHELSFETYYSNNSSDNNNDYYQQLYGSEVIFNQRYQVTNNNKWQLSLKADYTYPFTARLKLSAGYSSNLSRITNKFNVNSGELADKINYNEDRQSAYTNMAWNIGDFNLQSGIRFEASYLYITHNTKSTGNYNCFLPFASVQYKLGKKQTLRLNYRKSIRRPGMDQVSPFGVRDDVYTLSLGNPNLEPAYVHRFEFTHRIQLVGPMFVSYRPYVNFISGGIQQINLPATDAITRKQYINVGNETEYGLVLSGTLAFVKWWSISPSYTFFQKEVNALPDYGIGAKTMKSWRLGASSQFILPKEWVVFVQYDYNSPVVTQQGTQERNYQFVTGFYKAISKRVNITAYTLNPWKNEFIFNKSTTSSSTTQESSTGVVKYNWIFNIRLGINFNKGKEGKKVERQVETDTDSGGKKGVM